MRFFRIKNELEKYFSYSPAASNFWEVHCSRIQCYPKIRELFFEFIFDSEQPHQKILENLYFPDILGIKSIIS